MITENSNEQMLPNRSFEAMEKAASFEVAACTNVFDFEDKGRFTQLELTPAQKMHVSSLMQQVPTAMAAGTMANAYTVSFPQGLPHTLTALKQGGFGSMIQENGRFVGSASFYQLNASAALLGAFSAMSIATGQYFLTKINSQLNMMNLKIDKILEFLYGDKKAELMSEISFVKYAYENYSSIMAHEQQCVATLISLQESKKVAMKDIEFYMSDLSSAVNAEAKGFAELEKTARKAFQIKDSLELSLQLYTMSSMLEVYYAQNQDTTYLKNLENDASVYIDKCGKRILSSFSTLNGRINEYKIKRMEKVDKSSLEGEISSLLDKLNSDEASAMRKTIHNAVNASTQKAEYYISADGNMYTKAG